MPPACPYCDWSDQAYRLPAHLLAHHIEHIHIGSFPYNHCLSGYVCKDDDAVDFAVCLTCKKGTVADTTEGHGLRWMSLHSKKVACRAAHATAYTVFKKKWDATRPPPAEDPAPPPPTSASIATLWEECKSNKRLTAMVEEIEKRVTEVSEEYDEDPCFRPEEGFKEAIYTAIGFKRDVGQKQQTMEEMVIEHDAEIRGLRGVIREQADSMRCLETMVKDQRYEIAGLRSDNKQMQADLDALEEDNNVLRKENAELRAEVGSLKDEMATLREQMAAMQKEFDAYKKTHPL